MSPPHQQIHARISGPIVMIGFGSIGKGTLPLIERHFDYDKSRFVIIDPHEDGEIAIDDGAAIAGCFLEGRAGGNQAAGHHVHLGDGTSRDRIEWHAMPFLQRMICRSVSGSAKRSCAGLIIQSAIGRKTGFHFC